MKWIKKMLGIDEIIKKQSETNRLLEEIIRLQKHQIDNDCVPHSNKRRAR